MAYLLLDQIKQTGDIKKLPLQQLPPLCAEIRSFLIDSVSATGGHLSSNLGVVELTVALHRALKLPQDKILFDVGHQCYTHKLLTGRRAGFAELPPQRGHLPASPAPREHLRHLYFRPRQHGAVHGHRCRARQKSSKANRARSLRSSATALLPAAWCMRA